MASIENLMNHRGPEEYRPAWRAPVFNHNFSYWIRSHGVNPADVGAAKIVIFGIPKSGNTWLQSLLCDALQMKPVDPVADKKLTGIGMTHLPFCDIVANRQDFLHGVCLVRDPRDILVSFYHYSKTDYFREARSEFDYNSWDEFYYEWYLSRAVPAFDLHWHSETYARLGVPVLRFEKLRANTRSELARLIKRWGLTVSLERIAAAIEANEFEKLKKQGKSLNIEVPRSHFRSGRPGDFKNHLPPNILADFHRRFDHVLQRWGYD